MREASDYRKSPPADAAIHVDVELADCEGSASEEEHTNSQRNSNVAIEIENK